MFKKLFPLYLTISADVIGWGVVITIFAPLILGNSDFLPTSTSYHARSIWVGILLAIYSIGQFFSAPVLGEMSDNVGRKKMLVITNIGSCIGFVVSAISIYLSSVWLLFASRFITGVFAGNQSLAVTSIVDLYEKQHKAKQLARVSIVKGVAYAIGPYLGGKLSEPQLVHWFDFATPLWFAAIVFFLVSFCFVFFFDETFHPAKQEKINWLQGLSNIANLCKDVKLMNFLIVTLISLIGWLFYLFFMPAFLLEVFQFNQGKIGDVNGYLAIWTAIGGLGLQWILKRHISMRFFYVLAIVFIFIANVGLYYTYNSYFVWITTAIGALGFAVFQPLYSTISSNMANKETQGKLFGILTSIFALSVIISPLFGGWLLSHGPRVPLITGAGFNLLGLTLFLIFFYRPLKDL